MYFCVCWLRSVLPQVSLVVCEPCLPVELYRCDEILSLALFLRLVWLATQNHSTLVTETTVVPFLPVNPEYSSTRNQASGSVCEKLTLFGK